MVPGGTRWYPSLVGYPGYPGYPGDLGYPDYPDYPKLAKLGVTTVTAPILLGEEVQTPPRVPIRFLGGLSEV